jgi:uncharacterized RDD family membrane protein YckC
MRPFGDPMHSSALDASPADRGRTASPLGPVERLDSPEQVRLELEIAGPMSRAFAYSIDYSLILLLMTVGFLLVVSGLQQVVGWASEITLLQDLFERVADWVADPERSDDGELLRGIALSIGVWMIFDLFLTTLYFLVFETFWSGRTPGKRMTQIRVIGEDGTGVGWRESLLRNLLRAVDALPVGYLVGALAMIFSPRGQRLGDLVAGTLVVRDRPTHSSRVPIEVVVDPDVEAGFRFTRDELAQVGEIERRLIRRTLRRAEELSGRAAEPILERAVSALSGRLGRSDSMPPQLRRDFLTALLQASERLR